MKLQIVTGGPVYSGYEQLIIDELDKTDKVPDNSCEEVIAFNYLHQFQPKDLDKAMYLAVSKVRRGGKLSLNFVNLQTFDVYNASIDEMNRVLEKTKVVLSVKYLKDKLPSYGLKLLTSETNPSNFETTFVTERI